MIKRMILECIQYVVLLNITRFEAILPKYLFEKILQLFKI